MNIGTWDVKDLRQQELQTKKEKTQLKIVTARDAKKNKGRKESKEHKENYKLKYYLKMGLLIRVGDWIRFLRGYFETTTALLRENTAL